MTAAATAVVTLADRPDLAAEVPEILASRWPAFMLAGRPAHRVDLPRLLVRDFPQYQVVLVEGGDAIGAGLSVPVPWAGSSRPPGGWDDAVRLAAGVATGRIEPGAVTALSVTVRRQASGHGQAVSILRALRAAASAAGDHGMFAPVRPYLKARYPLVPMATYVDWRTPAGAVFDPWLRTHLSLGARLLHIAEESLVLRGTVAEWERWIGMPLPSTGPYVIDGGLVPLAVDRHRDEGVYREPNVWVWHP